MEYKLLMCSKVQLFFAFSVVIMVTYNMGVMCAQTTRDFMKLVNLKGHEVHTYQEVTEYSLQAL